MSKKSIVLLLTLSLLLTCGFGYSTFSQVAKITDHSEDTKNGNANNVTAISNGELSTLLTTLDPDEYGGAYYKDGKIHLLPILKNQNNKYFSGIKNFPDEIIIDKNSGEYSLSQLIKAMDRLNGRMKELEIALKSVDIEKNSIRVYSNWTDEKKKAVKEILGIDNILFNSIGGDTTVSNNRSTGNTDKKENNNSLLNQELSPLWPYEAYQELDKKLDMNDYGGLCIASEGGTASGLVVMTVHAVPVKMAVADCGYADYPIQFIPAKYSIQSLDKISDDLWVIIGKSGKVGLDVSANHINVTTRLAFPELLKYIEQNEYWDLISLTIGDGISILD